MFLPALVALSLFTARSVGQSALPSTCSNGLCFATVEQSESQMGATIALMGTPEALSSLDHEGGWEVWDCDSDTTEQTISIACSNPLGCDDLYHGGAVGTIVKLGKNCTNSEFGVIAAEEKAEDQSVPHEVARRLVKRGVETPEVRKVKLKELSEADGRHGNVSFYIFGSTWGDEPDAEHPHEARALGSGERHNYRRGVLDAIKELINYFKPSPNPNPWSFEGRGAFPVNLTESIDLFERNLFCASHGRARIGVTARAKVTGKVDIGVVVGGFVQPPVITKFNLYTEISAEIEARLKLGLSLEGTMSSGDVNLFEVGLPVLNVPGIFNVGPAFRVVANAGATLALDMDVDVALKYKIDNWTNNFPNTNNLAPELIPLNTEEPLTLAVSEHITGYGVIEGHVVAKLEVSVDAFSGKGRAAVYLGLDGYAKTKVSVKHQGRVESKIPTEVEVPSRRSIAGRPLPGLPVPKRDDAVVTSDIGTPAHKFSRTELAGRGFDTNTSFCASLLMGLNAHFGIEGNLFDILTDRVKFIVWKQEWPIYQQCAEELDAIAELLLPTERPQPPFDPTKPGDTPGYIEPDPWWSIITDPDQPYNAWRRSDTSADIDDSHNEPFPRGCDAATRTCGPRGIFRREAGTVPERIATPITCGPEGPVSSVTRIYDENFTPVAYVHSTS